MWDQAGPIIKALVARVDSDGIPDIDDPWPVKDIVYVAIVGGVMLAALLEWFLWVAAFTYCLVKVFQKAEQISVRLLSVFFGILFFCLRAIFLPIMVVTLPLPRQVVKYFPQEMVDFLQWFAFWSFAGLLTIPWLFCVYQLVTHSVGRSTRIKTVLDEASAPKVVIIMPCYQEIPEILLRTCDSLVDCEYPPSCLHIFLSFDGDEEGELYLNTIEKLGVPLTLDTYPKSIDVIYRSCRITISRFPHGGKRHCQKRTFKLIDKIYAEYLKRNDNLFVLFIDSDCILDKSCIQNFMYEMELKPGSKKNMLAQTGVITSTTEKNSLITLLQDMEYIHGQLFERSVESGCGAVTCLPGALTMLRFSAFRRMAKYYFADKAEQCDDLFDYGKCHLGEDRWLTHLFMIGAQERYQITMNTGAFCKTEAVQTYASLLKQRRRWFLGFITNEVCMLTDIRLWKRYPILLIVRFMQNTIRTTALLFFILVISLISTSQKIANLPVGFIAISLGLNWLLMIYFGAKLGRYKVMLYPLMFVINPFFNWVYMVYGIFTAGQRTWGGPRADAGAADTKTTPQQAIENAEATGDDLNVVPETFKPAAAEKQKQRVPLQPTDDMEGRFAPAERLPNGWYQQGNDSGLTLPNMLPRNPNVPNVPLHPRSSMDSFVSGTSANNSIYMPRRVESFMDPEDARIYHKTQETQKPAGGAFFEEARQNGSPYEVGNSSKHGYHESVDSLSGDSVYDKQMQQQQRSQHAPTNTSPLSAEYGQNGLEAPKASYSQSGKPDNRQGRSPLARQSYIRTAPGEGGEFEMQQPQQGSLMRDVSPAPLGQSEGLGGHSRSDSTDSKKRKRLTKDRK
jgi:chitin synthase